MGLHYTLFPVDIAYGAQGGPGFMTNVLQNPDTGRSVRVSRRATPHYTYDISTGITTRAQFAAFLNFFIARRGAAYAFPFYDHMDHSSAGDGHATPTDIDQLIGTGDNAATAFQLRKVYEDASGSTVRNITLPITGTVVIALDAVPQTSGWSVDTQTGVVTFSTPPGVGVDVTAGFSFYVPVRFSDGLDKAAAFTMPAFEAGELDGIELIEEPDEAGLADEMPFGGSTLHSSFAADVYPTLATGRLHVLNTATPSLFARLPDPSLQPTGPDLFHIHNIGTASVGVKNFAGTTLVTLATGERALCGVYLDASSVAQWIVAK